MKKFSLASLITIASALPFLALAKVPDVFPTGYWGGDSDPILSCVGLGCDLCGLIQTTTNVIYFGITVLFFILIPAFIMYGGFLILISGGSSEKVGTGKKAITGALIGAAIGLLAFLIVDTVIKWIPFKGKDGETIQWANVNDCRQLENLSIFKPATTPAK